MRYNTFTTSNQVPSVQKLSIYRSAIEVFTLSRKLRINPPSLSQHTDTLLSESLYEQLLTDTVSLPFTIAQASVTKEYSKKIYFQQRIAGSLHKLEQTCKELSFLHKGHKKEVSQLYKALKRLKERYHIWAIQLTQQN